MREVGQRPLGVTIIAILVALNGIAAIITAFQIFAPGPGGILSIVVQTILGLALLYLAYGLWTLQPWAWLATLIIEAINGLFALIAVVLNPIGVSAWVSLGLAIVVILYLLQPRVRDVFSGRRAL